MSTDNFSRRPRPSGNLIATNLALIIYMILVIIYYIGASIESSPDSVLENLVNLHDHNIYLENIDLVRYGESLFEFANDKGIASIYLLLTEIFPFWVTSDMAFLALLFNSTILLLSYMVYGKISDELNLGVLGRLSFFVNFSLLYFSQLINKDMLTILVFLLSAYSGVRGRLWYLILLIPFALFIRIQLVIFILVFIFIASAKNFLPRFWIAYTCTSLLAAYLTVHFSIIGEDSLGDGLSSFLINLNKEYLIGYFLFNPIRLLQYIYDAYLSFDIFTETGGVDVAKLLRLPQLVLLAALVPQYYTLYNRWCVYSKSMAKPLLIVILAFACTWLMNPTVNARYVMLITPILVLLGLYVRSVRCNVSS